MEILLTSLVTEGNISWKMQVKIFLVLKAIWVNELLG